MSLRFLNGHIEIDYEPVAKILEGKDWKDVQHKIEDAFELQYQGTEEQYNIGYEEGKDYGESEENEKLCRQIVDALEALLKEGVITDKQHTRLCEVLPG